MAVDRDLLRLSLDAVCRYLDGRCQHFSTLRMLDLIAMIVSRRVLLACWLVLSVFANIGSTQDAQEHLAAGEFAAAIKAVEQIPAQGRDRVLAQIASAQSSSGETVAAGSTLQGIQSPSNLGEGMQGAGRGGGSFADFQSLIDLIQTTVVPDTWEALGGPSTMAPYPQGVYVDATGTIRDCETFAATDGVEDLKSLLARSDRVGEADQPLAWRQPSALRCVSIRRLMDQWTRLQVNGLAPSDAMMQMAGISQVQYLILEDDDIVIAGPVGGIEQVQGWYRDRRIGSQSVATGLSPHLSRFVASESAFRLYHRPHTRRFAASSCCGRRGSERRDPHRQSR